eukprot:CAMPEP_0202343236 /NCGR_PEP_ID=MMETSP1126-20121109/3448_1 /ASSEMBLY_ACC=CAM_ASM_000457 /TAXON_ID=3047 /ORGANISM="Dunaliella tertiolecta, Strain CCMP1320" /LENGTH=501 /DNA_ID=CAMNT_0048934285 /DNA_START=163 /DNA_END=1668 /DNA_ORIENTATION=+
MVYSIQRHGAREVLTKTSKLSESQSLGGPALLPEGERQCYQAGQDFRERYLLLPSCDRQSTCLVRRQNPGYGTIHSGRGAEEDGKGFHNYNTYVRSSFTDRALVSAQSFFAGVFPKDDSINSSNRYLPGGDQHLPIYIEHDNDEDWLIRGYTKCKEYQDRLSEWFSSDEFIQKQQETLDFRASIESKVLQELQPLPTASPLNGSLKRWWNMYDAFAVSRIDDDVAQMPDISDAEFAQVRAIADWLEVAKMRSSLTKNLLGGPLLSDVLEYMDKAKRGLEQDEVYYKLLSISSHFNTQLGLLAALELDQHPPAKNQLKWLDSSFPSLASVLVFELHTSGATGGDLAVRLVAQDLGEEYVTVPLPCATPGDSAEQLAGEGACTYENFRQMAAPKAIPTASEWCAACKSQDLGLCKREAALQDVSGSEGSAAEGDSASEDSWSDHQKGALAGAIVATFVGTLLLATIAFTLLHRRLVRKNGIPHTPSQFQTSYQSEAYVEEPRA